jgi:transposase
MIEAMIKNCAGLDVHSKSITCTIIREGDDGQIAKRTKEFRTFHKQLQELAQWLEDSRVDLAVMESTGIYWKPVHRVLEQAGLTVLVVNAAHVKNVPGRKTDVQDSEWLAELGRCGLLRASFIPSRDLRELRLLTRYRKKLSGYISGEKNRLHKILHDCGITLGCVVSDIDGVASRSMIEALIEGDKTPEQIAELSGGRLRTDAKTLAMALEGTVSDRHRFLLKRIHRHISWLEQEIAQIDRQVFSAMKPYDTEWKLLQTIPGIDQISAAMLLAEIGTDMKRFGNKNRLSSWAGMCPGNNESAGKKSPAAPGKPIIMSEPYCVKSPTAPGKRTASSNRFLRGS